jgi:short-subunit dehydrogenase
MKEYILITGASSGIGFEMTQLLAAKKFNMILVARSEDKLENIRKSLTKQYPIDIQIMVYDLSDPKNAMALHNEVQAKNLVVSHLVNNAGFGGYGNFLETSIDLELDMINLNVSSLVILTKLFAQDMAFRQSGRILNVASILSFIPLPYYSVYSATKTFVLAFSETIAAELEGTGVIVTTLCPGTVETPFHTPEMRKTNAMSTNKPVPAKEVAEVGMRMLLKGKGKKIVGFNNWFIANLPRVTPDFLMMKIKKNLASIKN